MMNLRSWQVFFILYLITGGYVFGHAYYNLYKVENSFTKILIKSEALGVGTYNAEVISPPEYTVGSSLSKGNQIKVYLSLVPERIGWKVGGTYDVIFENFYNDVYIISSVGRTVKEGGAKYAYAKKAATPFIFVSPIISPIRYFIIPFSLFAWGQIIGLIVTFPGIIFVISGVLLAWYFYKRETTVWGKYIFPLMIFLQTCTLGIYLLNIPTL